MGLLKRLWSALSGPREQGGAGVEASVSGVDVRLEEEFQRYRSGEISLADYCTRMDEELIWVKADLNLLRESKDSFDPDEYELEREQLGEDLEAIRWRQDWARKEAPAAPDPLSTARSGKWARFLYRDSTGAETNREVVNWSRRGNYIVGYDRSRKAERTFRADRITDWQAG